MRGEDSQQHAMFSYLSPEQRVPQDHPLRKLRPLVDQVLQKLSRRFARMYARVGRPSIPPEKLLRALLLQVLYTVRSERLLMEQMDYNLLFRWFVGLNMDDAVWDATVYSKNRERLLKAEVAEAFFKEVVGIAKQHGFLSDEHFTVDGTLIEAWAGQKSFKKRGDAESSLPAGRSWQSHCEFPRGEAIEPDASIDHGPGSAAVPEIAGQRGEAGLSGPFVDGKPQRLGGQAAPDAGEREGGARGCFGDYPNALGAGTHHRGS